uniref:Uncharacterized protein n=1 Tax=Gallus gallus TaxID=9031 RepID=A0A8V1AB47_CHICK
MLPEISNGCTLTGCLVLETYPPLRVGVKPNSVHSPTDISRELSTVTTAARARPHFDFTMSIFPEKQNAKSARLLILHMTTAKFQHQLCCWNRRELQCCGSATDRGSVPHR